MQIPQNFADCSLGQKVEKDNVEWTIVRIVEQRTLLAGVKYSEQFIQLLSPAGHVEFHVYSHKEITE